MIPSWKKRLLKEQKEAEKFFHLIEEYEGDMDEEDDDDDLGDTPVEAAETDDELEDTDGDGATDDVDADDDDDGVEDEIDPDADGDGEDDVEGDVEDEAAPVEDSSDLPESLVKHAVGMLDDYEADDIIMAVLEAKKNKDLDSGE